MVLFNLQKDLQNATFSPIAVYEIQNGVMGFLKGCVSRILTCSDFGAKLNINFTLIHEKFVKTTRYNLKSHNSFSHQPKRSEQNFFVIYENLNFFKMQRRGNEVSLGTNSYNPLILVGLAWLQAFHNDYTYWTDSIANLMQLSWTRFVQAGDMSIDVIISRYEEIINSLTTRGVSATETLKDVFAAILRIFAGALQSTTNLWRASELFEMMRGHDTSEASETSSEASNETSSVASSEAFEMTRGHDTSEASNSSIASNDASETSSKASEALSEAFKAAYESALAAHKAEEEEKATIEAEGAQSETEAKTEDEVDNTKDNSATE